MIDNLAAQAAFAVFRLLGRFPLGLLQRLGVFFGWLGWLAPGSYKKRAQQNFSMAFPELGSSMERQAMEQLLQIFVANAVGKIAHVKFGTHCVFL